MKKCLSILALAIVFVLPLQAQKYRTNTANIWFVSLTSMEKIEAHNNQGTSLLDTQTGQVVFQVLMKGFQFEKALMQEHFNEKYVESDKFPKATFQGTITNLSEIKFSQAGTYKARVTGKMNLHGVTKPLSTEGTIEVRDGKLIVKAKFTVALADYSIIVPVLVRESIANTIDINVDATYDLMTTP
ncbi:MAG: YceI family protein [Bacteroidetes bacterium]|nr:MAG: YceI family protein [Bacteroidota bacterium]